MYDDRFTISVNSSINFSSMHSMTIHQIFFRIWPRRKPDQLHGTCDCASRFLCFLQKCRIGEWGADLPSPASQFAWFQSIPWLTKNCPALCCVNCVTCASMCARPWWWILRCKLVYNLLSQVLLCHFCLSWSYSLFHPHLGPPSSWIH